MVLFLFMWKVMFQISNIATEMLLQGLCLILHHIATITSSDNFIQAIIFFPDTISIARKFINLEQENFEQYVCCPKRCAIFKIEDCFEQIGSCTVPKVCLAVKYPRHPRPSCRGHCQCNLLKVVRMNKKEVFRPLKTYWYKSVTSSLTDNLSRPGILHICEQWRSCYIFPELFADVYDGDNGHFSQSYSYGLMLNVDWMEPFEYSIYSVGVIYLSLLNLPCEIHYAQENIIICGLIPGPKEPSYNINSFLEPLVTDLLHLWRGTEITLPHGKIKLRAALICVACDSPAWRIFVTYSE